jgi:hypothetical protein
MTPVLPDTDRSVFSTFVKHRKCHSYTRQLRTLSCHGLYVSSNDYLVDGPAAALVQSSDVVLSALRARTAIYSHTLTQLSCWEMLQPSIK